MAELKELVDCFYEIQGKSLSFKIQAEVFCCKKLQDMGGTLNVNGAINIAYDGGNHPEYASNMFSNVEDIDLVNGDEIKLCCEDGTMFFADILFDDIVDILRLINKRHGQYMKLIEIVSGTSIEHELNNIWEEVLESYGDADDFVRKSLDCDDETREKLIKWCNDFEFYV